MSENTVYTLAKTLQKTDGLEKDFAQMLSALQDTVEKEYLLKIRSAANAETAFAKEHPPKEVTLLRALSAFMDEGGRAQLDRMTKGLMSEDLPSAQSARMAGLLLTLALAEQF